MIDLRRCGLMLFPFATPMIGESQQRFEICEVIPAVFRCERVVAHCDRGRDQREVMVAHRFEASSLQVTTNRRFVNRHPNRSLITHNGSERSTPTVVRCNEMTNQVPIAALRSQGVAVLDHRDAHQFVTRAFGIVRRSPSIPPSRRAPLARPRFRNEFGTDDTVEEPSLETGIGLPNIVEASSEDKVRRDR